MRLAVIIAITLVVDLYIAWCYLEPTPLRSTWKIVSSRISSESASEVKLHPPIAIIECRGSAMPKLKKAPAPTPMPQPAVTEVPLHLRAGLSVAEAAALSGIGQTVLRALIAEGRVKAVRLGRALVIPRTALDAFLDQEANIPTAATPMSAKLLRGIADAVALTAVVKQSTAHMADLIAASKAERGASAS
jgi:excisionase family DNA binding protein